MKKTFFLLLAISSLAFISCGKIQEQDNHETNSTEDAGCFEIVGIIHNTESSAPEVKTQYYIGPEYATFSWTQNDEIQLIVYKTTQTQDQYRLYAESSSATTTFKAGSTTYDPIGGIVNGWLSTGFAIYPVSVANNGIRRDDYISYIKPSASPYDPVTISMSDSYTLSNLDNQLSIVPMIGIQNASNELVYDFYPAVGVLAFSISAVPVTATAVRLTSFDSTEPLCGTFSMTKGVPDIAMVNVQSGSLTRTVTLPSRTASQDITVYIPLPVGSIAHGLRIELLDGSDTPIFKKKYSDVLEIERGVIKTVSLETPEWKKLGKGKFFDKFPNNDYRNDTYADVVIEQNVNDLNKYRITNPYGIFASTNSITSESPDPYLTLTVDPTTFAVTFEEHATGITKSEDKIKIVCSGSNNKVVTKDAEGKPQVIRLAPIYQYVSKSGEWNRTGVDTYPDMIGIIFPGYDTDLSVSVSGSSYGNPALTFKAKGTNVATAKIGVAQYESTALNNMNNATAATETSISNLMGNATGKYTRAICVRAYNSDGAEIAFKKFTGQVLLSISESDYTKYCGEYSFGDLRYLPQYDSSNWHYIGGESADASDLSLVFTASDCPLKGNVMITKILGISHDANISDESFIKTSNSSSTLKDASYTAGSPIYGTLSGETLTFSDLYNQAFVQYNGQPVYFGPNSSETSTLTFKSSSTTEDGAITVTLTSSSNNLCLPFNMKASGDWDVSRCLIKIQNRSGSGNVIASRSYTE